MSGMVLYGLLFPSLGIHLFTSQTNPGSSSSTLIRISLVCVVIFIFIWLIFVLFLSLLCHPTHPYLLSPHFDFWEPTWFSAIVSHLIHPIFISPMPIIGLWSVHKTCPKHVCIYAYWGLLLAFPRLDINLDLSTACLLYSNLRVVLVDNSITQSWSLVPVCVCST